MALSQSLPTPKTHEVFRVVTRLAAGPPLAALALPVAPIAPEPFTPDVSTPVNVTTVIEDITLLDRVALTDTFVSGVDANARQISEVPICLLVRSTNAQVSPAPVTLLTVVLVPEPEKSVAINASSNSLPEVVENEGLAMTVLVDLSADTIVSVTSALVVDTADVKLIPARAELLTVTL